MTLTHSAAPNSSSPDPAPLSTYLDHAAATPLLPQALKAMQPFFTDQFYNPSAPYLSAQTVRQAYNQAKADLAHTIGAKADNLVVTSGATEAINLAFTAISPDGEILLLATEHPAVFATANSLSQTNKVQVIAVDSTGRINLDDLKAKLTPKTELVAIAAADNELGTIQPLSDIAAILAIERQRRLAALPKKRAKSFISSTENSAIIPPNSARPLFLLSDASQAFPLLDLNVARLGVDLLVLNSAKLGGPKGIGALYASPAVPLKPLIKGGGQERGLRSGTENVPALIGFAATAVYAKHHLNSNRRQSAHFVKLFLTTLLSMLDLPAANLSYAQKSEPIDQKSNNTSVLPLLLGHPKHHLANFCALSFPGIDAERLIFLLDKQHIYVSTGAACAAARGHRSPALTATGLSDDIIAGSLRLSFGPTNTDENVIYAATTLAQIIRDFYQKFSPSHPAPTVFLGLSGGVDSSLSAALLKEQGYHVVGVYMKNWSTDLPGLRCPWAEDLADAKRVATDLGIDFLTFDFETEYYQSVVQTLLNCARQNLTINPDVLCNSKIKFDLFTKTAFAAGADFIATGHYARVTHSAASPLANLPTSSSLTNTPSISPDPFPHLLRAADANKDQTYFLYSIPDSSLDRTIFPVGNLKKPAVKHLAAKKGLTTAYKKESMGICFIGNTDFTAFLKSYLPLEPGDFVDADSGAVLSPHQGLPFYTIGQRHGLYLGGGLPYYVVGKNPNKNQVLVSRDLNHPNLWTTTLFLTDLCLRPALKNRFYHPKSAQKTAQKAASTVANSINLLIRLRHRGELFPATLTLNNFDSTDTKSPTASPKNQSFATLTFSAPVKTPAPGQSAVFYSKTECLGGGIISASSPLSPL